MLFSGAVMMVRAFSSLIATDVISSLFWGIWQVTKLATYCSRSLAGTSRMAQNSAPEMLGDSKRVLYSDARRDLTYLVVFQ